MTSGLFITIEGIDGCGKSTQTAHLASWIEARTGQEVLRTFEPGGWKEGSVLRSLILGGGVPDSDTELLLFLADRSAHLGAVVRPALERGQTVLCERYADSTWAYQVGGRKLDPRRAERLIEACAFPEPDLTVFLQMPPEVAAERLTARGKRDHIEAGGLAFMTRVAEAYEALARKHPERILTVSALGAEDEVARRLEQGLTERLGLRP